MGREDQCQLCNIEVKNSDEGLHCEGCKRWSHAGYEKIREIYKSLQDCEGEPWFCGKCKKQVVKNVDIKKKKKREEDG